ncbi:MAG: hypothetical protein HOL01_17425 [Planctomycetaceae bacterium]|mgnify:CR=1 FL=1|jgi:hypothetical protein|nr:hypothetical protein [Planctomycetaceae bacterium]MBT6483550.1 hypothetical protein [Planctomycetaceae bacterium]MBT6496328.1 hypothetical protein [Planctomycetaceae bacterium]
MPSPIQHPVLGNLVPDQWNDELLTFREFPHMKPFWYPDRDRALTNLEQNQRQWVENWRDHTADLSPVCRDGLVHAALQSFGVYEVTLRVTEDDGGVPIEPQVAAYRYFSEHEERICRNVSDALLRYYRLCRKVCPDWFDDEDYPDDPTIEQLGRLVAFDGFSITRCSSGGMSALRLGWDPDWDPEHGLVMAVFQDQVLALGTDDVDELLHAPDETDGYGVWGPKSMTEAERSTLRQFIDGFEPSEDED